VSLISASAAAGTAGRMHPLGFPASHECLQVCGHNMKCPERLKKSCPYVHGVFDQAQVLALLDPPKDWPPHKQFSGLIACKFWLAQGRCIHENLCRNRHLEPADPVSAPLLSPLLSFSAFV
jgi:hypothetical protein